MKKKASQLLDHSQAEVLRLWERDYNSKFVPPQPRGQEARHTPRLEASSFDEFLLVDDSDSFDISAPINR